MCMQEAASHQHEEVVRLLIEHGGAMFEGDKVRARAYECSKMSARVWAMFEGDKVHACAC